MSLISSWAAISESFQEHEVVLLSIAPEQVDEAINWAAELLPNQYTNPVRISRILHNLGKTEAAEYLLQKLPTSKTTKSGELGEILGARYATVILGFQMVERLRWKDHDDMPMRGDDLVGVRLNVQGKIEFLKGEAKSRARLDTKTVAEADEALRSHEGLPAPHALSFVADRLFDLGQDELSDLIDQSQLRKTIRGSDVVQMLFTFSGNNPQTFLQRNTEEYMEQVRRVAVGVRVPEHQNFIERVYIKVVEDA